MFSFLEFVRGLVDEGEVVLSAPPRPSASQRAEAAPFLESVYSDYRLEVAGPLVEFDAGTAVAAGELVWEACWFLVNHEEPEAELGKRLFMPAQPTKASHHLSADLLFRYLPQIH